MQPQISKKVYGFFLLFMPVSLKYYKTMILPIKMKSYVLSSFSSLLCRQDLDGCPSLTFYLRLEIMFHAVRCHHCWFILVGSNFVLYFSCFPLPWISLQPKKTYSVIKYTVISNCLISWTILCKKTSGSK